jgi:nucleoid-associated protein YgaU
MFPTNKGNRYHIVKPGQTLQSIAREHSIPWTAIMSANSHMFGATLNVSPGERLIIPRI